MEEEDEEPKKKRINYFSTQIVVALMILVIAVIYFSDRMFVTIEAGHKGVLFQPYGSGTRMDKTYQEGFHVILPWNVLVPYNGRIQVALDTLEAITSDGVKIDINYAVNYRPQIDSVAFLHKNVGPNYLNVIILPEAGAVVREVISVYDIETLYSLDRHKLQLEMSNKLKEEIDERYLTFVDIMIEDIVLPDKVLAAIEDKLVERQRQLAYEYIINSQQLEVQRMNLEAQGVSDFESVSNISILKWKGLKVTEALATSPNAKVIVIGTDQESLPIILGGDN